VDNQLLYQISILRTKEDKKRRNYMSGCILEELTTESTRRLSPLADLDNFSS
jgi:hypothetical protein